MSAEANAAPATAWSPLRLDVFRALFLAATISNIGTWMHEVGAAWLMTSLTTSPLLVALLGTASSLPLFLFALPAGAIGDLVDKRKYLLFTQTWMTVVAGVLGVVTLFGWMTPWLLLSLTSALGIGVAMNQPVWQATVPEIVPREELAKAITFFGVSASAVWALLPLVGRQSLGLDSLGYGLLVGALGTGAVLMAMVLPRVRARLSVDQLVWIATAAFALVAFTLAFVHVAPLVYL